MQNTITPALNRVITQPARPSLLLKPIATANEIIQAWQDYQDLKAKLLSESDYQIAAGKKFIKKSGFRKLATAFGISTSIEKEERRELKGGFTVDITVRAIAPSGRYASACASCASSERDFAHLDHDVRATAQTRAANRAIADLIGGGEASAEEAVQTFTNNHKESSDVNNYQAASEFEREVAPITAKQRSLLIKLAENRFGDEETRNYHFKRIDQMNIQEASKEISEILGPRRI